jgi:hypothetical protein
VVVLRFIYYDGPFAIPRRLGDCVLLGSKSLFASMKMIVSAKDIQQQPVRTDCATYDSFLFIFHLTTLADLAYCTCKHGGSCAQTLREPRTCRKLERQSCRPAECCLPSSPSYPYMCVCGEHNKMGFYFNITSMRLDY